jgi:hypothetical protein
MSKAPPSGPRRAGILFTSLIYVGVKGAHPRKSENLWRQTGFFRQQLSEMNSGYHKTLPGGDSIITGKLNYEIICLILVPRRYGRCWVHLATLFYLLA